MLRKVTQIKVIPHFFSPNVLSKMHTIIVGDHVSGQMSDKRLNLVLKI